MVLDTGNAGGTLGATRGRTEPAVVAAERSFIPGSASCSLALSVAYRLHISVPARACKEMLECWKRANFEASIFAEKFLKDRCEMCHPQDAHSMRRGAMYIYKIDIY